MPQNKNLTIFSEIEKFALYELPDFNDKQRREYFSFDANELKVIMKSNSTNANILCALQMGYFKAKKLFFHLQLSDVSAEDLGFILHHYFPNQRLNQTSLLSDITNYTYYTQRKIIADYFGYKLWSGECESTILEYISQIIKRDTAPNFIALEIINFLSRHKIVRPNYTTLQTIISKSLTLERRRVSNILDAGLTSEQKSVIDKLIASEDTISKLAALKKDAKNFNFKMMLKERQKQETLEQIYIVAIGILKKLELSQQNIDYYVSLTNHYTIRDLRELKYNQHYLCILCYAYKRYRQVNDNIVEAFIYHTKKLDKAINDKVKINFADEIAEPQEKIGNLLLLYVNDKFDDTASFAEVRKTAFKIMSKENIESTAQKMLFRPAHKKAFKWVEVDKIERSIKRNLRALFTKLSFSSSLTENQWLEAIHWLQKIFLSGQKLSDRAFTEVPNDTIPKHLQSYLLKNSDKDNKIIHANRYEFWIYRQIGKQLSNNGLYIESSINYQNFNNELVDINLKKDLLQKLNIPWFVQSPDKRLDDLSSELTNLWALFNKNLKNDKYEHLKYDKKKQKFLWSKIKSNKEQILEKKFFKQFPFRDIGSILNFVNDSCNFLSALSPLQPRYSKQEVSIDALIATILAQAFNYGNHKMSQTSDISYRSLETIHQQYLRLSTLKAANDIISNAISALPIFPYYSLDFEILYSSVDGQKFELDTPNIKARYSRKYLREGQGMSAYTILASHIPLQCELIGTHEHESHYVFDIWYNNTTEIIPEVITGDMHSINKANFAILSWFGANLQPRFVDLNDQLKHLYCTNDIKECESHLVKPVGQIDLDLIKDHKSSIDQFVATLALKEMTQANLIKKLCHLPPENSLRKAVFEYDKLIRSIYTLKYMMNPKLQKNVHKSQNRLESYHQLRAAIAKVGGKKELYGATDIDIEISNQCARLVANAIIYYNSAILSKILTKYPEFGNNKKLLTKLQKISPVSWHHHIHFTGQYTFHNNNNRIDINKMLENIYLNI